MTSTGLVETTVDVATIAAVTAAVLPDLAKNPAAGGLTSEATVSARGIVLAAATRAARYRAPHTGRVSEHCVERGAL